MNLTTPALLFPAISLLMLAYTNRFVVLTNVIRQLSDKDLDDTRIIERQIDNLRLRLSIIKYMQTCGVAAFLLCAIAMLLVFIVGGLATGFVLEARWIRPVTHAGMAAMLVGTIVGGLVGELVGIPEMRRCPDDRLALAGRVLGLEDAAADEDRLGAELHHQRDVGRRGAGGRRFRVEPGVRAPRRPRPAHQRGGQAARPVGEGTP